MHFISTRGEEKATGAESILRGRAWDGGLFVPELIPSVSQDEVLAMCGMDYPERAAFILGKYFDEYNGEELLSALKETCALFEGDDPAPLVRVENGMYMLELFHGPTCAFHDLALAAFPYLLRKGRELLGIEEKLLVLAASSGDAGKTTLEYLGGVENVKTMVFHPEDGVSKMQRLQLDTTEAENVNVVSVRGSFDDCSVGVKKIMGSEARRAEAKEHGFILTTSNSSNFARIAMQIAFFFSAYCDLLGSDQIKYGDKVNFTVPAGSCSNLIAAYYAQRMGLPVGTILCASNKNAVLTDFFANGVYDIKRSVYRTMSSGLDVLVSVNMERLIFEVSGRNAALTAERMASLSKTGRYSLRGEELAALQESFYAASTNEDETVECIYDFFEDYGYPMDTHTGVAMSVAERYEKKIEEDVKAEKYPMVVVATASPYKFPQDVLYALTGNDVKDSYKGVKRIHLLTAMKVPECLKAIRYKPVLFKTVVSPDKMYDEVKKFLQA